MKRSGKTNRDEASDMAWDKFFPECAKLFQKAGWFEYFEKIDGYHSEVSYGFSQGLEKYTVLFNTLKIELNRELIVEATGLVDEGEFWFNQVQGFSYHYSEVDNKVQRWRTHQASRFTHKTYAYKWLNHDKDGTYNSIHINMLIG